MFHVKHFYMGVGVGSLGALSGLRGPRSIGKQPPETRNLAVNFLPLLK